MEDDKPTGICPECGREYFCGEVTCENPEHEECDIEECEDEETAA